MNKRRRYKAKARRQRKRDSWQTLPLPTRILVVVYGLPHYVNRYKGESNATAIARWRDYDLCYPNTR